MASFDTLESSVESSRPIEIYTFAVGGTEYRYTSSQDDITVGADTWSATAIARSGIAVKLANRNQTVTITIPAENAFGRRYRSTPPAGNATVSIIRLQRDEVPTFDTQALVFKGRVQSVTFPQNGHVAEITCQPLDAGPSRNIPRFTFMSSCNHVLFDGACGVNPASHNHTGEVTAVSANVITVDGLSASGIDARGGYAQDLTHTDFRLVLAQSGDDITLLLPFGSDPTGGNVQVFAGCDHSLTGDCATTFDNVKEFGGFPFVPSKNIFQTGLDE